MRSKFGFCHNLRSKTVLDKIVRYSSVLNGNPIIAGTRITVNQLLEHLAAGETPEAILARYPDLTVDGFRTAMAYAMQIVQEHTDYILAVTAKKPKLRRRKNASKMSSEDTMTWQQAMEEGCASDATWVRLARLRAAEHPKEVAELYLTLAERATWQKEYTLAASYVTKSSHLYTGCGYVEEGNARIAEFKKRHQRKTKLIKYLKKYAL